MIKRKNFENLSYHLVKHVVPCAQFRTHAWCVTKIQDVISERVQNRRKRCVQKSKSGKIAIGRSYGKS